jgi:hypothetical protein
VAELHLYDFDGTLFRSPYPPATWDGDWWNHVQSLVPPCVPDKPGSDWWVSSTVSQARRSISNPDVYAVLATGRPDQSGLRYRVPELLRGVGLNFDEVHLAPPKGTLAFKKGLISKLLRRYPIIDTVRIWEDRKSHLPEFVATAVRTGIAPENVFTNFVRSQSKKPECGEADVGTKPYKRTPSYLAAFLDAESRAKLVYNFPYEHHKARADHMTIARPVPPEMLSLIGTQVRMKVIGYAANDRIQAVVVDPTPALGDSRTPHITLSHAEGVRPVESNALLQAGWKPVSGPTLTGIVDVFPRSLTGPQRVAARYLGGFRY